MCKWKLETQNFWLQINSFIHAVKRETWGQKVILVSDLYLWSNQCRILFFCLFHFAMTICDSTNMWNWTSKLLLFLLLLKTLFVEYSMWNCQLLVLPGCKEVWWEEKIRIEVHPCWKLDEKTNWTNRMNETTWGCLMVYITYKLLVLLAILSPQY